MQNNIPTVYISQIYCCILKSTNLSTILQFCTKNMKKLKTRGHSETAYLRPLLGSETQPWNFLRNPLCNSYLSIKDFRPPRIAIKR